MLNHHSLTRWFGYFNSLAHILVYLTTLPFQWLSRGNCWQRWRLRSRPMEQAYCNNEHPCMPGSLQFTSNSGHCLQGGHKNLSEDVIQLLKIEASQGYVNHPFGMIVSYFCKPEINTTSHNCCNYSNRWFRSQLAMPSWWSGYNLPSKSPPNVKHPVCWRTTINKIQRDLKVSKHVHRQSGLDSLSQQGLISVETFTDGQLLAAQLRP